MIINATFWVAVSFFIFFGALIYLKVPQKVNDSLENKISEIKKELELRKKTKNWEIHIPPTEFTTDNAAMIGIVGYYKLLNKDFSNLNEVSDPRLTF